MFPISSQFGPASIPLDPLRAPGPDRIAAAGPITSDSSCCVRPEPRSFRWHGLNYSQCGFARWAVGWGVWGWSPRNSVRGRCYEQAGTAL